MLPIPENMNIDFESFANEFDDDEGTLVDLGQGDQTAVEEKATEPLEEEVEKSEAVEGEQPAEEQPKEETSDVFKFTVNDQPYEVTKDQIIELNNGYIRQQDYTRKLQWWGGWYQHHQGQVDFANNLDKLFKLQPHKAELFYKHILHDEPFQAQAQAPAVEKTDKTVQELLAETQQQPQQQQPQISPEVAYLYNIAMQQQQQLKAQQEWKEDYQLEQSLNLARQKYGDFDENAVLQWMYHIKTDDPEVAINRMIAEAWAAQARQGAGNQRPVQQQQQVQRQVQQPAPHVESGKRGGRGVAASQPKHQEQTYANWSAAQQALLNSGIF